MLVSVIIPNYNHAAYLKKRIDSVLCQNFQDFELVILDDCSSDISKEIIEQYRSHPKVSSIVYNETNSGSLFKQWKKGIELSKGEYIWIAESDDYADPDFLQNLVPIMESNPKLGLVYCDSTIVYAGDEFDEKTYGNYRNFWLNTTKWEKSYTINGITEIKENLLQMCTINNASAVLFRKDAILAVKPFDLPLRYVGDWYCYLKICLKYDISFINQPLNYYREHKGNSFKQSRSNFSYVTDYFLVYNWLINNLSFVDRHIILKYFKDHTRQSLIKNWNAARVRQLRKLLALNPQLFFVMIGHNIIAPFKRMVMSS